MCLQVECWICYDSDSKVGGSLIQPCGCKGDVGYVHHDCLRRWLVEAAQAGSGERELSCGVCRQVTGYICNTGQSSVNKSALSAEFESFNNCALQAYEVERDASQFSLASGFTPAHWLTTATTVLVMVSAAGGCWAAIQIYSQVRCQSAMVTALYRGSQAWIRMCAVGLALLIQYICLRFLGLNTVTAYQRAKVYGLKIMNKSLNRGSAQLDTVSGSVTNVRLEPRPGQQAAAARTSQL